jgi:3-methyladenine DNA glycosylase AlkD
VIEGRAREIAGRLLELRVHNAAVLRGVRRSVSADVADWTPRAVIELAVALLAQRAPGGHVVAYELVMHHPGTLERVNERDLRRLGGTMASWGEVDTFACYIAGRAWRAGRIGDEVIHRWARSKDRWWRRAALVSTVPLNVKAQGGQGDAERTVAVCELLIEDRDDMVVKAMSWALRELAVREPAATAAFLDRHGTVLAPRVLREVRSKLVTGRKSAS